MLWSLQVRTLSLRPLIPPCLLIHFAYAVAMAGMPGLLVALVSHGAQVMTVIELSAEPPWCRG